MGVRLTDVSWFIEDRICMCFFFGPWVISQKKIFVLPS